MPAEESDRLGVKPARENYVAVDKAERNWGSKENFGIKHRGAAFGVCPASFQCLLPMLPCLPLGMMYILSHCMLEV